MNATAERVTATHDVASAVAAFTPHAKDQCASRSLPVEAVAVILKAKLEGWQLVGRDVAVHIVSLDMERGTYFGSNGSEVWAIVRDGMVSTVMLRRKDQPATKAALHVDVVCR